MTYSRRRFLQVGIGATGAALVPRAFASQLPHGDRTHPMMINAQTLAPFVDPLPIPPVASPRREWGLPDKNGQSTTRYHIVMRENEIKVHRDLAATRMWTYDGMHPGPTFNVDSGEPVAIEWINKLPGSQFLPVDYTICGMKHGQTEGRSMPYITGLQAPAKDIGYTANWQKPGESVEYRLPNKQDAATLFYQDFALGTARLNYYAGMMGMFLIRDDVERSLGLPDGDYEIPLMLCDRSFAPNGQLYYPTSGIPGRPWVDDVHGNVTMVNGKLFPFLKVEPRKYRFRLVNASNTTSQYLALSGGRPFHQIGTDQGLLPAPIQTRQIGLAPAMRADLVIDFSDWQNQDVQLTNSGRPVMQFQVGLRHRPDKSRLPARLRPIARLSESAAALHREIGIKEYMRPDGSPLIMLFNNTRWDHDVTFKPQLGSVEIWSLINLSEETHPIHLHQVRFQILDRQKFDPFLYENEKKLRFLGPRQPPGASERGWHDIAPAEPSMVTRIIVPFDGYAGRYTWHCHAMEHAANELIRPIEIVPQST